MKDGKILITRRPKGTHLEGLWEFPGGKREHNETLKECMRREIKEELGLDIEAEELLLKIRHEYETKVVDLHSTHIFCLNTHKVKRTTYTASNVTIIPTTITTGWRFTSISA